MKKVLGVVVLLLTLVTAIGAVSAETLIAGKIYNADYSDTIAEADVKVTCYHDEGSTPVSPTIRETDSLSDGAYSVTFNSTECDEDDELIVEAKKGDLSGVKTGTIHNNAFGTWDLAIVNVPLVPEFGLVVGSLTVVSAVAVFFLIRRR
jgi:hypothetical protein